MDGYRRIGIESFLKKEIILILILSVVFFFLIPVSYASAYNRCRAIVVIDASDGSVLYSENPDVKMEIASTTKILTAITTIEHNDIFSTVTIPKEAVGIEGSSIYLRNGERWRVLDLLYGLMLRSGNDAAVALSVSTAGSIDAFVELMNVTSRKIGAIHSHFTNPHGLHDPDHYSTASDMAIITAYALKNPIFAAICATKTHHFVKMIGDKKENGVFCNKNKLLYTYDGAVGVKTGYTKHSGRCLISAAERNGKKLICVTLNVYDTYGVTRSLFDRCFCESVEKT